MYVHLKVWRVLLNMFTWQIFSSWNQSYGFSYFWIKFPCPLLFAPTMSTSYPEIGDSSFSCALWTFKQQLTLKVRARCGISIVLLFKRLCTVAFGIRWWFVYFVRLVTIAIIQMGKKRTNLHVEPCVGDSPGMNTYLEYFSIYFRAKMHDIINY